jgi:radical SAM protein with 4Fe4S-binding SPASM domain
MKKFKKIYVEITNICNLKCPFCSVDNRKKKQMSLTEFENVLIKINDYTDYLYLHVKGEPLLHSDFKGILCLCKKYSKKVNITTNGTLLKQRVNEILNSSVRQINISIHSLVGDYLKDIMEASKILSENKIYIVFRFWVYNDLEQNSINEILKFYDRLDLKDKVNENNIKINEYVYINKDKQFIWPSLNNDIIRTNGTCLGLKTHIGILSDGTVIPCCLDSNGVINLGNIFNTTLESILSKDKTKNIISGFNDNKLCEELCKKCGFKR